MNVFNSITYQVIKELLRAKHFSGSPVKNCQLDFNQFEGHLEAQLNYLEWTIDKVHSEICYHKTFSLHGSQKALPFHSVMF